MYEDELRHYGVLGMKWGVHRAKRNVSKASTARKSAKEWDEIAKYNEKKGKTKQAAKYREYAKKDRADAKKYDSKAKQIEKKNQKLAGGKKAYDYMKKQSMGETIAKSYLFGTYGALKYNQARSKGNSRAKSAVDAIVYGVGNNLTMGILSVAEPRS